MKNNVSFNFKTIIKYCFDFVLYFILLSLFSEYIMINNFWSLPIVILFTFSLTLYLPISKKTIFEKKIDILWLFIILIICYYLSTR